MCTTSSIETGDDNICTADTDRVTWDYSGRLSLYVRDGSGSGRANKLVSGLVTNDQQIN